MHPLALTVWQWPIVLTAGIVSGLAYVAISIVWGLVKDGEMRGVFAGLAFRAALILVALLIVVQVVRWAW